MSLIGWLMRRSPKANCECANAAVGLKVVTGNCGEGDKDSQSVERRKEVVIDSAWQRARRTELLRRRRSFGDEVLGAYPDIDPDPPGYCCNERARLAELLRRRFYCRRFADTVLGPYCDFWPGIIPLDPPIEPGLSVAVPVVVARSSRGEVIYNDSRYSPAFGASRFYDLDEWIFVDCEWLESLKVKLQAAEAAAARPYRYTLPWPGSESTYRFAPSTS